MKNQLGGKAVIQAGWFCPNKILTTFMDVSAAYILQAPTLQLDTTLHIICVQSTENDTDHTFSANKQTMI